MIACSICKASHCFFCFLFFLVKNVPTSTNKTNKFVPYHFIISIHKYQINKLSMFNIFLLNLYSLMFNYYSI
jgi:hypothetical protein